MDIFIATASQEAYYALQVACSGKADARVVGRADHGRMLLLTIGGVGPDLLLLDWALPFLQGSPPSGATAALIAALRRTEHRLYIIVFGCQPEIEQEALAAGANAFICRSEPSADLLADVYELKKTHGRYRPQSRLPARL